MARMQQQRIHRQRDTGWVVSADQVEDEEGQDRGENCHDGAAREEAEQRPSCSSGDRAGDDRPWLCNRGLGQHKQQRQGGAKRRNQKQADAVVVEPGENAEHQQDPQILTNALLRRRSPGIQNAATDLAHT